jgi:hypothetical protein
MAQLAVTNVTLAGVLKPALSAAAGGGDTVPVSNDHTWVEVANGGGSPITVTLTDPQTTPSGSAATNPSTSVTNGTTKLIRLPSSLVNAATGLVSVGYSGVTTVTVGAFTA